MNVEFISTQILNQENRQLISKNINRLFEKNKYATIIIKWWNFIALGFSVFCKTLTLLHDRFIPFEKRQYVCSDECLFIFADIGCSRKNIGRNW